MKNKYDQKYFLVKAVEVHGNKYNYSKTMYKNAREKVEIICNQHGSFLQLASGHLKGYGCSRCVREQITQESFITRSNQIHNYKYNYSKSIIKNLLEKIIITCNFHGDFLQTPKNHLAGRGCHICKNITKFDNEKFIKEANKIHNNKYDYSKINCGNLRKKIEIICHRHGSFFQEMRVHLRGSGCKKCFTENNKMGAEKFIKLANEVHKNKYDYSLVNYIGSQFKVKIICKEHGIFNQSPNSHLKGQGCLSCHTDPKKFEKIFINQCKNVHKNKYDYSLVNYTGGLNKVTIICPEHGQFEQKAKIHVSGFGCSKCSKLEKVTNQSFIERSIKIHDNKYDYSKINVINVKNKITIICQIHGEFQQSAANHLKGYGCFECNRRKPITTEEFIERANQIHNFIYDYSESKVKNTYTKVAIICKKHGKFMQDPASHLNLKCGCPKCKNRNSRGEILWLDKLGIPNDENHRDVFVKIGKKIFYVDGLDPENKICYEFYGDYWHGNPKKYHPDDINPSNKTSFGELYRKTMERETLIKNAGYQIISIWESDFKS